MIAVYKENLFIWLLMLVEWWNNTITMQLYHQLTKFCDICIVGVIIWFVCFTGILCQLFHENAYVI